MPPPLIRDRGAERHEVDLRRSDREDRDEVSGENFHEVVGGCRR
jgi:hypothetical protein